MFDGLSETTLLRIAIGVAALVLFVVIIYTSRRRPEQGKRSAAPAREATRGPAAQCQTQPRQTARRLRDGWGRHHRRGHRLGRGRNAGTAGQQQDQATHDP